MISVAKQAAASHLLDSGLISVTAASQPGLRVKREGELMAS